MEIRHFFTFDFNHRQGSRLPLENEQDRSVEVWGTAHREVFPNITLCRDRDFTQAGIVKVAEVDQQLVDCRLREEAVPHNSCQRLVVTQTVSLRALNAIH